MENAPLVSVITPCFNGESFLTFYFESILSQTYPNLQLIFVDDGSDDRTVEIAESFTERMKEKGYRYHIIKNAHRGQANAVNSGLQYAEGEYLIWPDSDDVLEKTSVEKRVRFLTDHPEYGFVRSNGRYFDFVTKEVQGRFSDGPDCNKEDIFLDLVMENTFCTCGCYMVRMSVLKEIYPEMRIMESEAGQNWQILIPVSGRTKCGYIDEDLYYVAVRENSHSRTKRSLQEEIERYEKLKEILKDGVKHSLREDANYEEIIEGKYDRILFLVYLRYEDDKNAKKQYAYLKEKKEVTTREYELYLKRFYPQYYKLWRYYRRVKGKLQRMLQGNDFHAA